MLFQLILDTSNSFLTGDISNVTTLLFKVLFIVAAFLYMLFAIVVVRQISIMKSTLITSFSTLLTSVGLAHLLLSIGVLIFFIVSL